VLLLALPLLLQVLLWAVPLCEVVLLWLLWVVVLLLCANGVPQGQMGVREGSPWCWCPVSCLCLMHQRLGRLVLLCHLLRVPSVLLLCQVHQGL